MSGWDAKAGGGSMRGGVKEDYKKCKLLQDFEDVEDFERLWTANNIWFESVAMAVFLLCTPSNPPIYWGNTTENHTPPYLMSGSVWINGARDSMCRGVNRDVALISEDFEQIAGIYCMWICDFLIHSGSTWVVMAPFDIEKYSPQRSVLSV